MGEASQKGDSISSTIHLWTRPKNQKVVKDVVLRDIANITGCIIDLRPLNVSELQKIAETLLTKEKHPAPVRAGRKIDYVEFLNSVIPTLKNANRLDLESLKKLAEEFSE